MAAKEEADASILWELHNLEITGAINAIDTQIKLCDTDKDFSIAYDINITELPSSGFSSACKLIRIIAANGTRYSLAVHRDGGFLKFEYMSTSNTLSNMAADRYRFVVTHAKSSGTANISIRVGTGSVTTNSISKSFTASSKNTVLGQTSGDTNKLPVSTINHVVLYNRVLSSAEINAFLGV